MQSKFTAKGNKGVILNRAKTQPGSEIFPDEKKIFVSTSDLKQYLTEIIHV